MKIKIHLSYSILLLIITLTPCTSLNAENVNFDALQGLGDTRYHRIKSAELDQTYHLFIRLPKNYNKDNNYPTLYLLDGGITYPLVASYYHYLRQAEEVPEMILVGLSYGNDDWQKGNSRSRDYTAKAINRDHWGGAKNFQELLRKKIIPLVESNYAGQSTKRIIFGQSIGGQFVLYNAFTQPDLFSGYISSNPALHRNLDFFLELKADSTVPSGISRMYVSSGSDDDPEFRIPALKWMSHWNNKKKKPWLLKTETLENQTHFSAAPSAFRSGIKWVLQ